MRQNVSSLLRLLWWLDVTDESAWHNPEQLAHTQRHTQRWITKLQVNAITWAVHPSVMQVNRLLTEERGLYAVAAHREEGELCCSDWCGTGYQEIMFSSVSAVYLNSYWPVLNEIWYYSWSPEDDTHWFCWSHHLWSSAIVRPSVFMTKFLVHVDISRNLMPWLSWISVMVPSGLIWMLFGTFASNSYVIYNMHSKRKYDSCAPVLCKSVRWPD